MYDKLLNEIETLIDKRCAERAEKALMKVYEEVSSRIEQRSTVIYSETGAELRYRMNDRKKAIAMRLRKNLFNRNNEDFAILAIIANEIEEATE